jgi:hypothetical protein
MNLSETLTNSNCQLCFEVIVPVSVLEITVADFKKRNFAKLFEKIKSSVEVINDDDIFEQHVKNLKWNSFKKSLSTRVLCQKVAQASVLQNTLSRVALQHSNSNLTPQILSRKNAIGIMARENGKTNDYLKENSRLPLILNAKSRLALYEEIGKAKREVRTMINPDLNDYY